MTETTEAPKESAHAIEPRWVVRVDLLTANGHSRVVYRVADHGDLLGALTAVLAEMRQERPDDRVRRIESFAPSTKALVARGPFG